MGQQERVQKTGSSRCQLISSFHQTKLSIDVVGYFGDDNIPAI